MKGILKNMSKIENIFYDLDEYVYSLDCPCNNNQILNYLQCENNNILKVSIVLIPDIKRISNFDSENFLSYLSFLEEKFDCIGFCNMAYLSNGNNILNMNKYLFSDNENKIKNFGCIYPLSKYLFNMIISFCILLAIYMR